MTDLKQKRLFLLDMDGTIYLDDDLFDGTLDFLQYVRSVGGRYMFLTNNSSKSVDKYIEKLARLGISATKEDFLTSTNATIVHLKQKNYKKIYAFGTMTFKQQLAEGKTPRISYRKLSGETVSLSVHKLDETGGSLSDTLWIFAKK